MSARAPPKNEHSSPVRRQRREPSPDKDPSPEKETSAERKERIAKTAQARRDKRISQDKGLARLERAKLLYGIGTESSSPPSATNESWWKKYFGCFSRCRSNSKSCCSRSSPNSNSTFRGGKYKRIKNKTIRHKRKMT